jgi:hypothetical protein
MSFLRNQRTPLTPARTLAAVVAAGALLALPVSGVASKPAGAGKPAANGKPAGSAARGCARVHRVGYAVSGTLVSVTRDDPATAASEATVTLTLTRANRHARRSGDIVDQDAVKRGVQAKGFVYTVAAGDAFRLRLNRYQGTDTPSVGDRVHVSGRIPLTRPRCAPLGANLAGRYGAVDVRRVVIGDRDPD